MLNSLKMTFDEVTLKIYHSIIETVSVKTNLVAVFRKFCPFPDFCGLIIFPELKKNFCKYHMCLLTGLGDLQEQRLLRHLHPETSLEVR